MSDPEIYSFAQAAFVLREPVREVRRTVERRNIQYHLVSFGGRKVRAMDRKTLVFLSWSREQRDLLSAELWRTFYESVLGLEQLPSRIDAGGLTARFADASKRVQARLKTLRELEGQVARNASGETVLEGTEIEVHRIAALLNGGMTIDEVIEDYPSLNPDQVAFAQAYAAAHPKPGRPYPGITAKAAMRQADFSGLDLDN